MTARPRPRRLRHPRPAPPATRTLERARPRVPADARVSGARADLGRGLAARAEARRLAGAGHRGRQGDRANPQRPGRHEFLPELTGLADALAGRTAVLDGELVAAVGRTDDFYVLTPGRTLGPRRAGSGCRARFVEFDVLYLDDPDVYSLPYLQRRALLEGLRLAGSCWRTSNSLDCHPLDALLASTSASRDWSPSAPAACTGPASGPRTGEAQDTGVALGTQRSRGRTRRQEAD